MVVDPSITNFLFMVQMIWLLVTPYVFLAYYHYDLKPKDLSPWFYDGEEGGLDNGF